MVRFSSCVAILMIMQLDCFSQTSSPVYVNATVNVTIIKGISVETSTDLSFGAIVTGSGTWTILPTEAGAGSFAISGQSGSNVTVTFPSTVELRDANGHNLTFTPVAPIWNVTNSQTTGQKEFPAVTGGTVSFSRDGTLYLWFGGSLSTEGASIGEYAGNYAIKVTY